MTTLVENFPYIPVGTVPVSPVRAQVIADAEDTGSTPPGAQLVYRVYPSAATLFHELFHLIHGPNSAPSVGDEEYDIKGMHGLPFKDASRNPESYVVSATSYHYTRNSQPNQDGYYIEFNTGYITQG